MIEQNKTFAVSHLIETAFSFQPSTMKFSARTIPYQQTGYFSGIITEYLNGSEFLRNFYEHPVSFEGIEAAIHERENFATDRQLLVHSLEEQYSGLAIHAPVAKNISSLSDKSTFTITTAHQPAIFTGPLYFIYKMNLNIKQ